MNSRWTLLLEKVGKASLEHPARFLFGVVLLCTVSTVAAALGLHALTSGGIGPALLSPYLDIGVSRLRVVQLAATTAAAGLSATFIAALARRHVTGRKGPVTPATFSRALQALETPRAFWMTAGLAVIAVNAGMFLALPAVVCIEPDTIGYLSPNPLRSSGYMIFIHAIMAMGGDLTWLPPAQLNLMLASFVVVGWTLRSVTGRPWIGLFAMILPASSAAILILATQAMTEALFVALACLHLSACLSLLKQADLKVALAAGVTLALLILVRPNGISFLAGLPVLFWLIRGRRPMCAAWVLIPVVVLCGIQATYNDRTFGFFGLHRFGGISMAGNAAPLFDPEMPSRYPALVRDLAPSLEHYARDFGRFDDRGWPFEVAHAQALTTVGAIYLEILPAVRDHLGLAEPAHVTDETDPRIADVAGSLALSAIRNNPLGFLEIVTANYIANVHNTLPVRVPVSIHYPRCLDLGRAVFDEFETRLTPFLDAGYFRDDARTAAVHATAGLHAIEVPRLAVSAFQITLAYGVLLASCFAAWALTRHRWRHNDTARSLIYTALVFQAGYAIMSLGNASFARYTVVFDPLAFVILLTAASLLTDFMRSSPDASEAPNDDSIDANA